MNALLLTLALLAQSEPLSGYERASRAVCRVNVGSSFGSGCAIHKDENAVYVLTNCHVAQQGQVANVEFWRYGYKSEPIIAECKWSKNGQWLDMSVLEIPLTRFDGWSPEVVPICAKDYTVKESQTISSFGCPRAEWAKAWTGHVKNIQGRLMEFEPASISGQSGSAIFTADFSQVIGLLAWNTGGQGGGMHAHTLWQGLLGEVSEDKDPSMDLAIEQCQILKRVLGGKRRPDGDCPDGQCPVPRQPTPGRGGNRPAPIPGFGGGGVTPIAPKPDNDIQKQIDEIKSTLILISKEKGPQGERGPAGPAGADGKQGPQGFAGPPGKDANVEEWAAKLKALDDRLSVKIGALESHPRDDARVNELLAIVKAQNEKLAALEKLVNSLSGGATIVVNP